MQFKILPAVVAGLAFTSSAAALGIDDVVDVIDGITKVSGDAADIAQSITKPINIVQSVPKLINDFRLIVQDVLKSVTTFGDADDADFGKDDQGRICDAFHDFVKVHQNLLSIVIGKKGLLSGTPFTAPLGAVLRVIEGGVDKLATTLIGFVPTCADRAKKDQKALDATLDEAVSTYSFKFNAQSKQADGETEEKAAAAMPGMSGDKAAMPAMMGDKKVAARGMAKDKMVMSGMPEGKMGMTGMAKDKMNKAGMAEEKMGMPGMAAGGKMSKPGMATDKMSKSGMMKVRKEMPGMAEDRMSKAGMAEEKMGMPGMAKGKMSGMAGTMDAN